MKRKKPKRIRKIEYLLIWKVFNSNDKKTLEYKRAFTDLNELSKFSEKLEDNPDVIEIVLYQMLAFDEYDLVDEA